MKDKKHVIAYNSLLTIIKHISTMTRITILTINMCGLKKKDFQAPDSD